MNLGVKAVTLYLQVNTGNKEANPECETIYKSSNPVSSKSQFHEEKRTRYGGCFRLKLKKYTNKCKIKL